MDILEPISNVYSTIVGVFEEYGWYILIASVILIYIYHKVLREQYQKYKEYKFEREYSAKYHKNPDVFSAHQTAQQRWVEKMQEKLQKESEEHLQKQKEKEERKRQELIEKYGDITGKRLGSASDNKDKPTSLKPEYHPLMGSGSSSTYRPPKRKTCGGGGCGR